MERERGVHQMRKNDRDYSGIDISNTHVNSSSMHCSGRAVSIDTHAGNMHNYSTCSYYNTSFVPRLLFGNNQRTTFP